MKKTNDRTVLSYTKPYVITSGILTACAFILLFETLLSGVTEIWLILLFSGASIWAVCEMFRCIVLDFTVIFDEIGFTTCERNRLNAAKNTKTYKWNDIRELRFINLCSRSSPITLLIVYRNGRYNEIEFRYSTIPIGKFKKLAQQYSGREGIIKSGRQLKPFEKNW